MARQDTYNSERLIDLFHVFIILQTLQHYTPYVIAEESHNQAFIQTDKHLTYIVGDNYINSGVSLEIKPGSGFTDLLLEDENYFSNTIRLDPPRLDFENQPVGMPRMENVIVQNTDPKNNLHLLSISGSTVHFHCSFFQDKIVPPGGNTSFDVVFLARQVGHVENTLFIHTSKGSMRYQVFGVGVPNPYRLRPYLGARVPVNSSFTPLIQMHNPHSTRLQVLEMFASEGDLHLELPSGERESTKELWEIQPFETKAVMRANFVGRVENNHTAFIRIRTTKESWKGPPQLLVLPLEVEVSSVPGLYSPVELLDFGILRTLDEPKTIRLSLINTGLKVIHIVNVTVSPPNEAMQVDFRPFKLQADSAHPILVATISFTASKALLSKQWAGRLVVKTKGNLHNLIIPYQANVLHGSLVYQMNSTHFFSGKELWNVSRPMLFTNTFSFPVVIYNISLPKEVAQQFSIESFHQPVIVQPQQKVAVFVLKFHPNRTQTHFTTMLTLYTNASTFSIPIVVYNGLMKVIHHRPEKFEGQLDFGTLGIGESSSMIFTIRNDNPVDIVMAQFESNMTWATIEILGMEKGNGTILTRKHNKSEINIDPLCIKPYHYAVFNVTIIAPQTEGVHAADIWMFTQFQDLFIPIIFRAAEGSLHAIPDKILFEKVYPGRVPYKVLQIRSTFDDYMEVTQVSFQPADARFYFVPQNGNTLLLQPHEQNTVGKIYFDTKRLCDEDCYVGISPLTPAGHQWLLGLTLDKDVADTDQYLYTKLRQKWEQLVQLQQNIANVTIELDTNQVRGFLFSAQAHLHWPSLVRKAKIRFPLTQIGNISVSDFIVENSGNEAVLVQVLPLSLYPNTHSMVDLVRDRLRSEVPDYIDTEDSSSFVLYDLEPLNAGTTGATSFHQLRKSVETTLGVVPHKNSLATLLLPGHKIRVKVGFRPRDEIPRSSLIIIRNNLTIVDAVVVQGEGSHGEMRFSSRKPSSNLPLTFEMTEKHLKNCDERKSNRNILPNFTVRRSFTLRNTGDLAYYVHGFSISDWPCEGYGFKVLECAGFEMLPNTSRKVNIAFTPDFTMSQIQRLLTVHTSLGPPASHANYSLQAMVPYDLLSRCSAALPRPSWEPLLYYFVVCLVGFIVCCIMVLAYFESGRVMADYLRKLLKVTNGTQTLERGKVFDLRNLNNGVTNDCSSSQPGLAGGAAANTSSDIGGGKFLNGSRGGPLPNGVGSSALLPNGTGSNAARLKSSSGSPAGLQQQLSNNAVNHTTTAVNGSKKKSFVQNLQHVVKSFALRYFKSRKRFFQPTQQPQTKLVPRDDSPVNSGNSNKSSSSSSPDLLQKQNSNSDSSSSSSSASSTPVSHHHHHPQPVQEATATSEKSIPTTASSSSSSRTKKGKVNKNRQSAADSSEASNHQSETPTSSSSSSRKHNLTKKDSLPQDGGDRKNSATSVKGFDETPSSKNNSSYDQIDDFDDYEVQQLTSHTSKLGKSKNRKNKSKSKSEPHLDKQLSHHGDHGNNHHHHHHPHFLADEVDEVSSTTTESSGPDVDDKNCLIPECSTDITIIHTDLSATPDGGATKWRKGGLVVATHGDELLDDDSNFEITSKSKAHRKIRIDKETYGGDIMKPDTYDLPYTMKEREKPSDKPVVKKPKKIKKKTKGPGDFSEYSIPSETFALKHRRLSSPNNSTTTSSTLTGFGGSAATSSYPVKSGLSATNSYPLTATNGPPPGFFNQPSATASGRQSSYSSIVSSNSGGSSSGGTGASTNPNTPSPLSDLLAAKKQQQQPPQQQHHHHQPLTMSQDMLHTGGNGGANNSNKPSPSSTGFGVVSGVGGPAAANGFGSSSQFAPFSESSCLSGLVSDLSAASTNGISTWSSPASDTMTSTSYGLHDASNGNRGFNSMLTPATSLEGSIPYTGSDQQLYNAGSLYGAPGGESPAAANGANNNQPQMTMMQQLQADRRRRLWEHQLKVLRGEEWPGFSTPFVRNDSLWDHDCKPSEAMGLPPPPQPIHGSAAWSTNSDLHHSPAVTPSANSFWNTLTNSASSGWSSLQSLANIWAHQPQQTSLSPNSSTGSPGGGVGGGFPMMNSPPPSQTIQLSNPPFNPFTSMADIWSPTSSPPPPSPPGINNNHNNMEGAINCNAAPGGPVQWMSPPSGGTPPPPPAPPSQGGLDPLKEE